MMEQFSSSEIIITSCIVLILTLVWKLLDWAWFTPKKMEKKLRAQGLKGNSYRPIRGDLEEINRMREEENKKPFSFTSNDFLSRCLPFFHQQFSKYGDNFISWLGPIPVIHITDPELIRDVFARVNEFRKARPNPLVELLAPGIITLEGKEWAIRRKLLTPAFTLAKINSMGPPLRASLTEVVKKWDNQFQVSGTGSIELDVYTHIRSFTADFISRAAFGSSFEEGDKIFELLQEQLLLIVGLFQSIYIPGFRFLPTKTNRRIKKINQDIEGLVKGIIEKRKKAMDAGEPAKDDLLGLLMESNSKESRSQGNNNKRLLMSFKDIVDECKVFYLAGQETTSALLVWTFIMLSKHQDWQSKAREEVKAVFGSNLPDMDGANNLKVVTMILNEVLRLCSTFIVNRRVHGKDVMLGNLCVPKGAIVSSWTYKAHTNPKVWGDDAMEFNPQRFSEGIAKATNGVQSYFPFLGGPRVCIGQHFTFLEARMFVATLLQRFSFELSPTYTLVPHFRFALEPKFGAHLIITRL